MGNATPPRPDNVVREELTMNSPMCVLAACLLAAAAFTKWLAHTKDTDGNTIMEKEAQGFLKGVSWLLWSAGLLILGAWYGANYTN
jgi:hypothetical protein